MKELKSLYVWFDICNSDTCCKDYKARRHRRRKSETLRAQYIDSKEVRYDFNLITRFVVNFEKYYLVKLIING